MILFFSIFAVYFSREKFHRDVGNELIITKPDTHKKTASTVPLFPRKHDKRYSFSWPSILCSRLELQKAREKLSLLLV